LECSRNKKKRISAFFVPVVIINVLNYTFNFAAFQTAGADINSAWSTVYQGSYFLNIGLPSPLGFDIGVANRIAGFSAFAANCAFSCQS
jgi:hypothetical protein